MRVRGDCLMPSSGGGSCDVPWTGLHGRRRDAIRAISDGATSTAKRDIWITPVAAPTREFCEDWRGMLIAETESSQ
jgi:hypothetical protein